MGMRKQMIVHHHVGAREGHGSIHTPDAFKNDMMFVFYDADPDCVDDAQKILSEDGLNIQVYPYCISDRNGKGPFNLMVEPYLSSLFRVNKAYADYYYMGLEGQYLVRFGDACATDKELEVEYRSLDALCRQGDAVLPPPDCLTIDAQGAAYEVISGAETCLADQTVCIHTEVEFHKIYDGQKLFGDLSAYLSERGFIFCNFDSFMKFGQQPTKNGCRSTNVDVVTNALFLKSVDSILAAATDDATRVAQLYKLAFYAALLNQFEMVVQSVEALCGLGEVLSGSAPSMDETPQYIRFVRELAAAIDALPDIYPPPHSVWMAQRKGQAPGATGPRNKGFFARVVRPLINSNRVLRQFYESSRPLFDQLVLNWRAGRLPETPVDRVLMRYGLREQAVFLRIRRAHQNS